MTWDDLPELKKVVIKGKVTPVTIIKKEDDTISPRISLGGVGRMGYYFVYRGPEDKIETILETCLWAFKKYKQSEKIESSHPWRVYKK